MSPKVAQHSHSIEFQRPINVYRQMYAMSVKEVKQPRQSLGLLATIILACIFVVLLGWSLRALGQVFRSSLSWADTLRSVAGIQVARAAASDLPILDDTYTAKYVGQSVPDPIQLKPGEQVTVKFRFRNVGTATWQTQGRFLSAYTVEPKYRNSLFRGSTWKSASQTAAITGQVKPGGEGVLLLDLKAPTTPGEYIERFSLSAENHTWIKGGYFFVKIKVVPAASTQKSAQAPAQSANTEYKARRVLMSTKSVKVAGGEIVPLSVAFQNTGALAWKQYALISQSPTQLATVQSGSFTHDSWKSSSLIAQQLTPIQPKAFVRESFSFRAPTKKGIYTFSFALKADDTLLSDVVSTVSVEVTSDAPYHEESVVSDVVTPRLTEEPRIRVGVWKPESYVTVISNEDDYDIFDGANKVAVLPRGTSATLKYSGGQYSLKAGEISVKSSEYIRLAPVTNPHAIFRLTNFERLVDWKGPVNFNAYRGALEYRLAKDGTMYLINDLLFEDYVAGIAETSNASHEEYIKALLTAARTYAYYIQQSSGKHDNRHFDVVAHTGDQLYLGYQSEKLMPRVAKAAADTRGYMVTYDTDVNPDTLNDVVITPYYGNSDGRTRAWTEVWGGKTKSWLVPVEATYDKRDGKKMWGHGVGMSARDAVIRAEEGMSWIDLLKYYYTGIEVEKVY